MYGCLGFVHSRFYAKHLAALVTAKGREILLQTKDLVQNMNLDVIYGDTDSIMINSNTDNYNEVFTLGTKVQNEVNKKYKLLELAIDGVFKYMLLLKKKKYAALTVSRLPSGEMRYEQELKGLDIVRRDWSQLSSDAGRFVISSIMTDQSMDERMEIIHTYLEELKDKLLAGKIPLSQLCITKQLTKPPEDYPDKKSLPHVQVAMRLNSKGKRLKQGDTVAYIICDDGSNLPAMQRAYSIEEVGEEKKVDYQYYLSQQIHPVVARLVDPMEGTDAARIAVCLGLDPTQYKKAVHYRDEEDAAAGLGGVTQMSDEEKYKNCDRFSLSCPECKTQIEVSGVFKGNESSLAVSLLNCENKECKWEPLLNIDYIRNCLSMKMRQHIQKYYAGWLVCDDQACPTRVRQLPLRFSRGFPVCSSCENGSLRAEYTDGQLYTQLCYYLHIFDVNKAFEDLTETEKQRMGVVRSQISDPLKRLYDHVDVTLKKNDYSTIDLGRLFGGMIAVYNEIKIS